MVSGAPALRWHALRNFIRRAASGNRTFRRQPAEMSKRNPVWPYLSRAKLPRRWNLFALYTSTHIVKERKSPSRIIPVRTVRVIRVSGDYRVRSIVFHTSGGIAAQIRKGNLKSGTRGGAGAEGRRHEIAGGITEAIRRGQEPGGAGRRVARGRQTRSRHVVTAEAGSPKVHVASSL